MLQPHEVAQIRRLAAQDLSQREIARRTGRHRRDISKILEGDPKGRNAAESPSTRRSKSRRSRPIFSLTHLRCQDCGRLVQHPCLACRIERLRTVEHYLRAA